MAVKKKVKRKKAKSPKQAELNKKKKAKAKKSGKKKATGVKKAKAKSRKSPKGRKKSAPSAGRGTSTKSTAEDSTKGSSAKSAKPASKLPSIGSVSKAFPKTGQARNLKSAEKMDELFEGEDREPAPPMYESLLVVRDWLNARPAEFIKKQVASFVYKGEKAGYPCHVIHSACEVSVQALTRDGVPTVEVHSPGHPVWSQSFGKKPLAGLTVLKDHFNEMSSRWMELIDYYIELETERGKAKAG